MRWPSVPPGTIILHLYSQSGGKRPCDSRLFVALPARVNSYLLVLVRFSLNREHVFWLFSLFGQFVNSGTDQHPEWFQAHHQALRGYHSLLEARSRGFAMPDATILATAHNTYWLLMIHFQQKYKWPLTSYLNKNGKYLILGILDSGYHVIGYSIKFDNFAITGVAYVGIQLRDFFSNTEFANSGY